MIDTCKINQWNDKSLNDCIRIAKDEEAVHFLGAWIGNHANDSTPWEPILAKIKAHIEFWKKSWPTMASRKIVVQAVVGSCTQFLAKAQGMPKHIKKVLISII